MQKRLPRLVILVAVAAAGVGSFAQERTTTGVVDRSASLRFVWEAAPAAYDPPFAKNQFQESAYTFPVYDSLVRLDANGNIVPAIASSWSFSPDKRVVTFKLRNGIRFTDGSDLTAAEVVKSLNRSKKDPASLRASQMTAFEAFEAPDRSTVLVRLSAPDENAIYTLATSTGMIVSGKAIDGNANLASAPVGSGPYKLVASGSQGATYERNDGYFDKSQNQFAKVEISRIGDVTARINSLLTGQTDAAFLSAAQWPQIQQMVATGKFKVHKVLGPNSFPLMLNTKIKPLDNPKVRLAMNLAIDREAISKGIFYDQCTPASQPLQPGVVGHDDRLKYKRDVAKAKALMQEAGVAPFTIDVLANTGEPYASVGVALKAQLQEIGITLNLIPTNNTAMRPQFRSGAHGGMITGLSSAAPDPVSIIEAALTGPDSPGGVPAEITKAATAARAKAIGTPDREAAFRQVSKLAFDDPQHLFVCWAPVMIVARKEVMGIEKMGYVNAVAIPDIRNFAMQAR
ncbi:MAG TPA: ABC transporter substrate-binding protein [Ramlibacter sp.]|nr:ABC transporter substrate-binding protein [Ramlibacter sp.]